MGNNLNHHEDQEALFANPIQYLCDAVTNLVRSANGNGELKSWARFPLDKFIQCFGGVRKEFFLTEKPLARTLNNLKAQPGDIRDQIWPGTRITLVANRCDDSGLELGPKYLDDRSNEAYPYFRLLYSNPTDPRGQALGLANVKPAPLLQIYPEEILLQCSFVVDYENNKAQRQANPGWVANDDEDSNEADYFYLATEITEKYERLQEILKGRMK